jgi:hypothetical protein
MYTLRHIIGSLALLDGSSSTEDKSFILPMRHVYA